MVTIPIRQEGFNSGVLSKKLLGKISLAQYNNGLYSASNILCLKHGPAATRPGFRFVYEVGDSTKYQRLIPFSQSTNDNILLEVGEGYFRFYTFDGQTVGLIEDPDNPGNAYEVLNSFTETQIKELSYVQSQDVLYICHSDFHPKKLSRIADNNWNFEDIGFLDGPYQDMNTNTTYKLKPSAATGAGITITASGTGFEPFTPDWVGRHIRIQNHSTATQWGWAKVTAYISTTKVTADVIEDFGGTTASKYWQLGEWSDVTGYPSTVTIHQQRLVFANWAGEPQKAVGSKLFSFTDFSPSDPDGTVSDDHSFSYRISNEKTNNVLWVRSHGTSLILGADAGEYSIYPSGTTLSPLDIASKRESSYGSIRHAPVISESSILFIERLGRRVRAIAYDYVSDSYKGPELTVMADDITIEGIEELAYQQQPQSFVWGRLGDGTLIGLTYDEEQKIFAWHTHSTANRGRIKSIAVLPSPEFKQDMLFSIVQREINGSTVKYIEVMDRLFDEELEVGDFNFLDSSLKYSGTATYTLGNLDHLEGETVRVLRNNAILGDYTVSSGSITLDREVEEAVVGLVYDHSMTLLPPNLSSSSGVDMLLAKAKLNEIALLTRRTTGVTLEASSAYHYTDTLWARKFNDKMDQAPSAYEEVKYSGQLPSRWSPNDKLTINGNGGVPMMIVSTVLGVSVNAY